MRLASVVGVALGCLFLLGVAYTAFQRIDDLREAARWVDHTIRVSEAASRLMTNLDDAETGERGFIITGNRDYLRSYDNAQRTIPGTIADLRFLTADNPAQQDALLQIDKQSQQITSLLQTTIAIREARGFAPAAAIVASGKLTELQDSLSLLVERFQAEENRLLSIREDAEEAKARVALSTTVGGLALAALLLACAGIALRVAMARRERDQVARVAVEAGSRAVVESEERLRVTLMSIGDAVAVADAAGRVTRLNPVAERLSGWPSAEAAGLPLAEVLVLVNELTRQEAENPVDRVFREGAVVGLANHTLLVSRDGREIPIDDSAAPIRGVDGTIIGVVMVFRDITERRKREREETARVDSEHARILASAEALARMGSWRLELASSAFICSPQMRRIFGFDPDATLTPELFFGLVHPEERDSVRRVVSDALAGCTTFRFRARIVRQDGTVRVLDSGGEVEVDERGTPSFLFGFSRDVTEEVRAEEALREQTELYEKLLGAQSDAGDGVAITDGTRMVYVNEALARIYGYTVEELKALPSFLDLVVPEERERLSENLRRRMTGESPDVVGETRIVRKDGRQITVEYAAKPVQGKGQPLLISIIRDVTARREADTALRDQTELYEKLLGAQSDVGLGVAITDGTRIVYVNDALARMYGYSVGELMEMPSALQLVVPADRKRLRERLGRRMQGEPVGDLGETTVTRKDGRQVVNAYAVKPVQVKGRTLIISLVADITENRRAEESIRQLSQRLLRLQDEEQERIAREMKSTVGKTLEALLDELAAVRDSGTVFDWKTSEALRESQRLAQEAAIGIRTLSRLLYPPMLDEEGLAEAIRWYSYDYTQSTRVKVMLDVPPRFRRLGRDAERTLFRVVQESLANVARHSGSLSATVRLREEDGGKIRLEIVDAGKGIPAEILERTRGTVAIAGVGIRGMVERMRELGGAVEISSDDSGTTVTAMLHPTG
ncbi:MAG TPA: PAS domain S-box protein [Spirochaetia bacterium]|nr:PAS domain S-box protein [Spirochaetia bacterium]